MINLICVWIGCFFGVFDWNLILRKQLCHIVILVLHFLSVKLQVLLFDVVFVATRSVTVMGRLSAF